MSEDLLAYHEITDVIRQAEGTLAQLLKEPDESAERLIKVCTALVLLQRQWHLRLGKPPLADMATKRGWKRLMPDHIDFMLILGGIGVTLGFWEAWRPLGWMSGGTLLLLLGGLALFDRARRQRMAAGTRRT